jgi:PAS domain S-box-containing protein
MGANFVKRVTKLKLTPKLTLVFVSFAAALLIVVGLIGYNQGQAAFKAATINELQTIAGEKEAAVADWVKKKQAHISVLSAAPSTISAVSDLLTIAPDSPEGQMIRDRLEAELKPWVLSGEFLDLFLLAPRTGQVMLGVRSDQEGKSKADRAYFLEGKKGLYTTPVYFSPELQAPTMLVAAPILAEDGKLLAVLVGRLDLEELSRIIQRRSGLRQTDEAFLVNASRLAVTQPRFLADPAVLRKGINTLPVNLCIQQKRGIVFANDYRNVPVVASYRWMPEHQLCLIVKIAQAEAFAAIEHLRGSMLAIILATLGVATSVAHALSRTIVRPILSIQTAVQRYGRGDLEARLPETRQDELGVLAHEFNQMAASLAQKELDLAEHARTLEQTVHERTKAWQESTRQLQRSEATGQVGSWAWHVPDNSLIVSDGLYKLLGLTGQGSRTNMEIFLQCIHPQDRKRIQRTVATALQTGGPFEAEFHVLLPDAEVRTLYVRGESSLDGQGAPLCLDGVLIDVTERKETELRLADAHEFMQHILTSAPIGIFTYRLNGECLSANAAAAEMVGATVEQLERQNFHELESWKRSGLYDLARQAISSKELSVADVHVLTTFGRDAWYRAQFVTFKSKGEELLLLIFEDITGHKQAQAALEASEKRFRTWIENSSDMVTVLDTNGVIQYESRSAKRLLGYEAGELLGRNAFDFVHVDDQDRVIAAFGESIQNPNSMVSAEFRFLHRDGSWRFLEGISRAYVDEQGEVVGLINSREITDRKLAEKSLQEKEYLLSEAQRIGRIGSWSYDIWKEILTFSDEMYRLLDILPEEFQHNKNEFLALVYPSDRSAAASWMADMREGTQAKDLNFRIFHKNGELCYLHCTGAVEFDSAGKPVRFIGTTQDVTERRVAEIQIGQQLKRLTALSEIDRAIVSSFDQSHTLRVILAHTISQLQVDAADILVLDSDGQALDYAAGQGFRTRLMEGAHVPLGVIHAGRAAKERRMIRIPDLRESTNTVPFNEFVMAEGFISYVGIPLIVKGKVKGVLEVYQRTLLQPYQEWLDFFNALGGQTAIAIESTGLWASLQSTNEELIKAYDATIEGWSRAMDLRDRETAGHIERVVKLTLDLARSLGMDESRLVHIRRGALLHDIGKLGVPDHILFKPGELTVEEREIIERHTEYAYEMLAPIPYLKPALNIPYFHHEKWDGSGYPLGLKGEQIPLEARIFAVVDVWDALLSDQPYRRAWSREDAIEYICSQDGVHFDPRVVECFLGMIKKMS